MYRKLDDFLLGMRRSAAGSLKQCQVKDDGKQVNNLKLEEVGHFMDDGLGDKGGSGEGAGEEASAIQRPGLMVSA